MAATSTPSPTAPTADLPTLTGLRAAAAFWVAGVHCQILLAQLVRGFAHGYMGVDLFFVLSGFILTHVYGAAMAQWHGRTVVRYMALRLGRIWPGYIVAHVLVVATMVAISVAGTIHRPAVDADFWYHAGAHALMLQATGLTEILIFNIVGWSVSVEMAGYLAFPVLAWAAMRLRPAALLAALPLCLALVAWAMFCVDWQLQAAVGPRGLLRFAGEFTAGIVLYRLTSRGRLAAWPWDRIAAALLAAMLVYVFVAAPYRYTDLLAVGLLALLVPALAWSRGWIRGLFAHPAMIWLGEISYGVFLMHYWMIIVVNKTMIYFHYWPRQVWEKLLVLAVFLVLSAIAGAVLYYLVEKPARNWVRRRVSGWR